MDTLSWLRCKAWEALVSSYEISSRRIKCDESVALRMKEVAEELLQPSRAMTPFVFLRRRSRVYCGRPELSALPRPPARPSLYGVERRFSRFIGGNRAGCRAPT
jgi:hypothetical protein